jgi:hypothetical protein
VKKETKQREQKGRAIKKQTEKIKKQTEKGVKGNKKLKRVKRANKKKLTYKGNKRGGVEERFSHMNC